MIRAAASAAKWERRFLRARVPSALAAGGSLCAGAAHPALASCGQALFFEAPHELLSATPRSRALSSPFGVTIAHGGVLPNINPVLLPKKTASAAAKESKEKKSPRKAATKSPKKAADA